MDNYVLIMAPAIILAAVITAIYGRVYDKKGFGPSVAPALGLLMVGFVLLYLFKSRALVFAGSLLMMCGYLAGMAVFGAMLRDHTPQNRSGMFQGLRIVGQVLIPGIIGPAIGAWVLRNAETVVNDDGTTSFIPNENIFLAALIAAVLIWVVMIPMFRKLKKEK
jgi:MFS family permease